MSTDKIIEVATRYISSENERIRQHAADAIFWARKAQSYGNQPGAADQARMAYENMWGVLDNQ